MNNWESELEKGIPPDILHGVEINLEELGITLPVAETDIYDPWKNIWTRFEKDSGTLILPDFKRSIVVKIITK